MMSKWKKVNYNFKDILFSDIMIFDVYFFYVDLIFIIVWRMLLDLLKVEFVI